ncbi:uncharacterized protein LOC125020245 [Mugil cephalus]|uniref:uncharacterized protein LOC125020245 n=1 Tax=Mugil cephalus TaxID=48193 RepID=UPI001FB6C763|nr:uncharacterized protein LOC125020245 [Mugil cephalus]
MIPRVNHWMPPQFFGAYAPFPRSAWINPKAPMDSFDRVCKNIWSKAKEAAEELGTGQSSPNGVDMKTCIVSDNEPSLRAKERQKDTADLGVSTQHGEDKNQYHANFTLPDPQLRGPRNHHIAKPAQVVGPDMESEMKLNKEEAERKREMEKGGRTVGDSHNIPDSGRKDKQSSVSQPLVADLTCSASKGVTQHLPDDQSSLLPPKLPNNICESEDEPTKSSSDKDVSDNDDDFVPLPGVRSCATSSGDESEGGTTEVEKNEISRPTTVLCSDGEREPSLRKKKDPPTQTTIKAGPPSCPTEPSATGKSHGQWEIPLSSHPHDVPTATLASGVSALVQAPVQGKAEAPQAHSTTYPPPVIPEQQKAYDLLADFPALQPPKKPLALGVLCHGNPETIDAEGKRGTDRQDRRVSWERREENMPLEVSSICAGDQKSVLDLQTFGSVGQLNPPTVNREELKANNQPPPRVAGTDGTGVGARSWARVAKAGMKQAAAPQEKARPCAFQQIVTINRAKGYTAAQRFASRATAPHQGANQRMTAAYHRGRQPRNFNRFARPGFPLEHFISKSSTNANK